jgi:hypothetical protein
MSTQHYEHMDIYLTRMSTSKRISQLYLKIHEVDYQERLTIDEDITSH